MTKIKLYILNEESKRPYEYEGQLIPMIGDKIDIPQRGLITIVGRVFEVDKPHKLILIGKKIK